MNKLTLIASSLALTWGITSFASTPILPETVNLAVDFEISKCSFTGNSASCDSAASLGSNINIELSQCVSSSGGTACTGTWTDSKTRDGYAFDGAITITKTVYSGGTTSYSLTSSVGPTLNSNSIPHSTIEMYLTNGKVTDGVRFSSAPITIAKDSTGTSYSYTPSLLITAPLPH